MNSRLDNQLREDIDERVHDRLRQWLKDSVQLYEIADLSPGIAVQGIFFALVTELTVGMHHYDIPAKEIATTIYNCMRALEQRDEAAAGEE